MDGKISVFVDSDVFVALARKEDTNHKKSLYILHKLRPKLVKYYTSNYVFAESVTVISQKVDRTKALSFIKQIKSSKNRFSITWIDEIIEATALGIFEHQTSKNVSFVDCTNMALMKYHHMDYLFSFDSIYKKNGFKLIEELLTD